MTMQEGPRRRITLEDQRADFAAETAFRQRLTWRTPLFRYDPNGAAVAAMAEVWQEIHPRPQLMPLPPSVGPRVRKTRADFQRREEAAVKREHEERLARYINFWDAESQRYEFTLAIEQHRINDIDNPPRAIPLVPIEQEQKILETMWDIAHSDKVEAYRKAGQSWYPKGNLAVPISDGKVWVDFSTKGPHGGGGDSSPNHYADSMSEDAQLPILAAALTLAGRPEDKEILHVASSYGLGMKMLQLAGFGHVMGIDIDEHAVQFAQSQGLDAEVMDAAHMDIPDESYDLVVSRNFLVGDYTPYPYARSEKVDFGQFFDEQYRVTRKGGCIVFTAELPHTPLSHGRLPLRDVLASNLANARHIYETGLVRKPLFFEDDFYPIVIFQK